MAAMLITSPSVSTSPPLMWRGTLAETFAWAALVPLQRSSLSICAGSKSVAKTRVISAFPVIANPFLRSSTRPHLHNQCPATDLPAERSSLKFLSSKIVLTWMRDTLGHSLRLLELLCPSFHSRQNSHTVPMRGFYSHGQLVKNSYLHLHGCKCLHVKMVHTQFCHVYRSQRRDRQA